MSPEFQNRSGNPRRMTTCWRGPWGRGPFAPRTSRARIHTLKPICGPIHWDRETCGRAGQTTGRAASGTTLVHNQ